MIDDLCEAKALNVDRLVSLLRDDEQLELELHDEAAMAHERRAFLHPNPYRRSWRS